MRSDLEQMQAGREVANQRDGAGKPECIWA